MTDESFFLALLTMVTTIVSKTKVALLGLDYGHCQKCRQDDQSSCWQLGQSQLGGELENR